MLIRIHLSCFTMHWFNVVWGNTYKTKLIPILNIQKKILRLLTFSPYREHSKPLFDKYKILNIYQINDFLIGLI